jgi:hypothetical protein
MRVEDVGSEEFEEAHAGALAGGGELGQSGRSDRDELVHDEAPPVNTIGPCCVGCQRRREEIDGQSRHGAVAVRLECAWRQSARPDFNIDRRQPEFDRLR